MTIELRPEQQRVIDRVMRSGAYQASEVLDHVFEIIREQFDLEDWMLEERDAIAARIEKAFAQAARGELIDGDLAIEILRRERLGRVAPEECMRHSNSHLKPFKIWTRYGGTSRVTAGTPQTGSSRISWPLVAGWRSTPSSEPGGRT